MARTNRQKKITITEDITSQVNGKNYQFEYSYKENEKPTEIGLRPSDINDQYGNVNFNYEKETINVSNINLGPIGGVEALLNEFKAEFLAIKAELEPTVEPENTEENA
ncbi:hypothetical protein [Xanthovirga aplysinae]|uniref:hypothetical protein n=1 Tax=Xanthovirga aplysinae TaxID=2529853 RepID=UPI0012BC7949|nr:hypothetical protein [Xanthovirga aplysinae]MTI30063.1 hypothetical protein [Xanthovirga aplysinae]